MDQSSMHHHQPPPFPRPTLSTDVDKFRSDQHDYGVPVRTPDALDFYRQHSLPRKPYGGLSPSASDLARSFESPTQRSASSPPVENSPTFIPSGMQRSSIKDLVARFNHGSSPDGVQKPGWKQMTDTSPPTAKLPHTPAKLQKNRRPPGAAIKQDRRESAGSATTDPKASSFEGYPPVPQPDWTHLQNRSSASLQDQPRAPLFGEVTTNPEQWANPGYGIPKRRGRRGSEGSMHQPNAMFNTRSVSNLEAPPPTPPMWKDVESYQNGIPPQSPHSRSRSDTSGLPGEDPNRQSQSRIYSRSTQNNAIDTLQVNHGIPRRPMTPPEMLSPRKYETVKTPGGGQRMKAIITAPTPKISPPLRSSRPRQNIGDPSGVNGRSVTPDNASSGSPSRMADRQASRLSPERRMEIGGMDFATRRESIRNAVRKSSDQGLRRERILTPINADTVAGQQDSSAIDDSDPNFVMESAALQAQPKKTGQALKLDLKDIDQPATEEVLTATTEFEEDRTPPPPMPGNFPQTATPEKSGFFPQATNEEQNEQSVQDSETEMQSTRQRTVLSQVLEMRKRSARELSHIGPIEPYSPSNDGTETIQIMLGDTLMLSQQESQRLVDLHAPIVSAPNGADSPTLPQEHFSQESSQPWASQLNNRASLSGCLTLDSDAYSVINKILDQYHESGSISPSMVHEFQQHIVDTDPELLNDKDTDSLNRVAQIALEELINDHTRLSSLYTNGVQFPDQSEPYPYNVDDQNRSRNDTSLPLIYEDQPSASEYLAETSTNVTSISQATSFEDGLLTSQSEQDFVPVPPPKDEFYQATLSNEGTPVSHALEPDQSSSNPGEQPVLPEIRTTDGGLGLAYGQHSIQTNAGILSNLPPPPMPFERARSTSPGIKADHAIPVNYDTTPQSDVARPVSAQHSITPTLVPNDTPATSISQKSFEDVSRKVSLDNSSNQNLSAEQKRLIKRKQIIKELVDTEYSYNQDMKVVEDIYMGTATAVDAMSTDDRRVLFGNSVEVVKFSESFLDALKSAVSAVYTMPRSVRWRVKRDSFSTANSGHTDPPPTTVDEGNEDENDRKTTIGEAFCKHMSQMERVYSDYLKNHDYANQRLAKLQTIPQVSIWLNECHTYATDITSAWDLDSLIVKPVQRILKYPLLLKALLEVTPEDHPGFAALNLAATQMLDVSQRINESKKRVELLDQVVNHQKKEFDVTLGLSKAFGRRTEKFRQQVGLSDAVEDPDYQQIAGRFGRQFFQLQVVMRDVEVYKKSVEEFMSQFNRYTEGFEEFIDVGMSGSPEIESKWRKFAMIIREMSAIAWVDYEAALRRLCIDPMVAALKMHENPQKLMAKRKKRLVEYAKYKTLKDRGDRPDRKTTEQGEQFIALNDTLKDELPKLYDASSKLVEVCLKNFVGLQLQWYTTWQRKIKPILEKQPIPNGWQEIEDAFLHDFSYPEANALALGVCNGSILADASNFLSPSASFDQSKASSTVASSRRTTGASEHSPGKPQFAHSQSFPYDSTRSSVEQQRHPPDRQRANSNASTQGASQWPTPPAFPTPNRAPMAVAFARKAADSTVSSQQRYSGESTSFHRPTSSSTYYSAAPSAPTSHAFNTQADATPPMRAGVFSSAMPMPDSPDESRPASPPPQQTDGGLQEYKVLFLAASLFEFNIDRARKEAGYPYLTYVPGEVFDVIAEKGELWLAKNQDDPTNMLGWIWEKHFAKLISEDS